MTPLQFFVPCKLWNPTNGGQGNWHGRAAARKRLRLGATILARGAINTLDTPHAPAGPWRVRFHCHVWSLFDDDGLAAACKPIRDALVDAGMLDSDAPQAGHQFVYTQGIKRDQRGVHVSIEAP